MSYEKAEDVFPFDRWLSRLRDRKGWARIRIRMNRVKAGNFGDYAPLGDGVYELKFDCGPGYRVYFGLDEDTVVLLIGGDKSSQESDIRKAKEYWKEYCA